MKESMNVAKSLAYKLTPLKRQKELIKIYKDTNLQGLHVHCPEGAVLKTDVLQELPLQHVFTVC